MKKNLLLILCFCYSNFCNAQAGKLDPAFGNNGLVLADFGTATNYNSIGKKVVVQSDSALYIITEIGNVTNITKKREDGSADLTYGINGISTSIPMFVNQAAIQTDGKIVLVGHSYDNTMQGEGDQFTIARINTNGSLDTSFSNGGILISRVGDNNVATSVAIQKDGKIVVVGYIYKSGGFRNTTLLYRFDKDGKSSDLAVIGGEENLNNGYNFINGYEGVEVQDDGKIIAIGLRRNSSSGTFSIIRHNVDGSIDKTFPPNNYSLFNVGFAIGLKKIIALQRDGSIIVAGTSNNNFRVAHFTKDGKFDTMQNSDFDGQNDIVTGVAIQKNDEIVLSGYSQKDTNVYFAIAKYTSHLKPDSSFSEDGKLLTKFNSQKSFANDVAIQKNGKIVASGYIVNSNSTSTAVARYNIDGTFDDSFATNGKLVDTIKQGSTKYSSISVQKDGKIIIGGNTHLNGNAAFVLARYTTDGKLDETFATGGKFIDDFGVQNNQLKSIAIQTDGKILAGGSIDNTFAIIRYNTDGSLDKTFGINGLQKDSFGVSGIVNSICIQSDGKILAGGTVLARYNMDGTLDTSFNGIGYAGINAASIAVQDNGDIVALGYNMVGKFLKNGKLDSSFGFNGYIGIDMYSNLPEIGRSILVQHNNKILVSGYSEDISRVRISYLSIMRYNSDGSSDNTFNGGRMLHTQTNRQDYGHSLQVQKDNKIILAGYSYVLGRDIFRILRYNTDASLDSTFNHVGILGTAASGASSRIESIVISGNNLYAAGFGEYPGNFGVVAKYFLSSEEEVLPMKLVNFKAQLQNTSVMLRWQVENQLNLKGFLVERSTDSIHFKTIGYVAGKENSPLPINYSTEDNQPLKGLTYYRLKMETINSVCSYSAIVCINTCNEAFMLKISPNPVKNRLTLITNIKNEKAILQVIDNNGMMLREIKTFLNGTASLDINTLPFGMYNLQIITKSSTKILKFIKE